jgi:chromosome segregation ATPase
MQFSPLDAGAVEASYWSGCLLPLGLGMLITWGLLALFGRKAKDNTEEVSQIQSLLSKRDVDLRDRETELGNMRGQLKNLEGEYGSLKASREKLDLDLKAADKRAADASSRLVTVENDLKASNTARIKLEDDLKRKDGELSAVGAKLTGALGDFDKAKLTTAAQIAALTAGAATAAAVIKSRDSKIGELEGKLKTGEGDWSAKFAAKDKEIEDYKLRLGKLEGAVKEGGDFKVRYDKDVADLKAQLVTAKADGDKAKTVAAAELAALAAGGAAAAATIKSKDTKLAELEARIKALDGDLAARNKDLGDYKLRFEKADTDLKASVSTKDKELADWKMRFAKLEGDAKAGGADKDKELADLKAQLAASKSDADKAKAVAAAELAALAAGGAAAAATIKSKDTKITELEARVKALDGDLVARNKDLGDYKLRFEKADTDLKASVSTKDKELADWKARYAKLETDWKTGASGKDKELADLKAQLAATKSDADKAKTVAAAELAALTAGGVAAAATIKSRDTKIVELETRIKELGDYKTRFEKADTDLKASFTSVSSKDKDLADLRARLAKFEADLKVANDAKGKAEGDLGACNRERDDLRKRVTIVQDEANKAKTVAAAELAALTAGAATAAATIKGRDTRIVELEKRLAASEADLSAARGKDKALADAQAEIASLRASNAKSVADWEARLVARDTEWKTQLEASSTQLADTRLKLVDAEKARDTITTAASKLGIKAVVSSCPQHLSDIHGIGTVFEGRLFAHGIGTFFEVAHLTNDDLTRMLEITGDMFKSVNFDGIRMDAMKLAEETKTVGRTWSGEEPDDLEPIDGIGHVFEKRLYDAGICTYEALINTPEAKIMDIISQGKKMVTPPNIPYWMAQTKKLLEAKQGKK